MAKQTFKQWCSKILADTKHCLKDWRFYLGFAVAFILLESPSIVTALIYIFTGDTQYLMWSGSWLLFTLATTLPIPVIPLSLANGIWWTKLLHKRKDTL